MKQVNQFIIELTLAFLLMWTLIVFMQNSGMLVSQTTVYRSLMR